MSSFLMYRRRRMVRVAVPAVTAGVFLVPVMATSAEAMMSHHPSSSSHRSGAPGSGAPHGSRSLLGETDPVKQNLASRLGIERHFENWTEAQVSLRRQKLGKDLPIHQMVVVAVGEDESGWGRQSKDLLVNADGTFTIREKDGTTSGEVTTQELAAEGLTEFHFTYERVPAHWVRLSTGEARAYDPSKYTVDNVISRMEHKNELNGKVLTALALLPGRDVEPKDVADKIDGYNGSVTTNRNVTSNRLSTLADIGLIKKVKDHVGNKAPAQYRALSPAEKNKANARSLQQRVQDVAKLQNVSGKAITGIYGKPGDEFNQNKFTAKNLATEINCADPQARAVLDTLADAGLVIEISPSINIGPEGTRGATPAYYGAWSGITLTQSQ